MFFLPPFLPETACLRFGGLIFRQERGRRQHKARRGPSIIPYLAAGSSAPEYGKEAAKESWDLTGVMRAAEAK